MFLHILRFCPHDRKTEKEKKKRKKKKKKKNNGCAEHFNNLTVKLITVYEYHAHLAFTEMFDETGFSCSRIANANQLKEDKSGCHYVSSQ